MSSNFIKDRFVNLNYYQMFYIATGSYACAQILAYIYKRISMNKKRSSQTLMYKSIIEKKQSS